MFIYVYMSSNKCYFKDIVIIILQYLLKNIYMFNVKMHHDMFT